MSFRASRPELRRRAFLILSAQVLAIAAAAWFCVTPLHAQTTRTLKIGYILSKDSQLGAGAQAFADEVSSAAAVGSRWSNIRTPRSAAKSRC